MAVLQVWSTADDYWTTLFDVNRNIKAKLVSNLQQKSTAYSIITRCEASTAGIRLLFSEPLTTAAHAKELAAFIDCILLTYVTEYKRT